MLGARRSEAEIHLLDAKPTIGVLGPEQDELMELLQKDDQHFDPKEQVNNEINVESGSILILRYCTSSSTGRVYSEKKYSIVKKKKSTGRVAGSRCGKGGKKPSYWHPLSS